MSFINLFLFLILFLMAAAVPFLERLKLKEGIPLSLKDQISSIICPSVPVCNCNCAPIINVTCPSDVPPRTVSWINSPSTASPTTPTFSSTSPLKDHFGSITCPFLPLCHCNCAPIINVTCPSVPPASANWTNISSTTSPTFPSTFSASSSATTTSSIPIAKSTLKPTLDNCQVILKADSGSFASPNYPHHNYPDKVNCSWLIIASSRIEIWFTEFQTENKHDVVKVYDGATNSSSELLSHSGPQIPPSITSYNNQVLVTFNTDHSLTYKGFNASYSLYDRLVPSPIYRCGGRLALTQGEEQILESPNFPNPYPSNSDCKWFITSPPGTIIEVSFLKFNTRFGDNFTVYNKYPESKYDHLIEPKAGIVNDTCVYLSASNEVLATFRSSLSFEFYSGFRVRFAVLRECGGYLNNSNHGVLETRAITWHHSLSRSYCSCLWRIRVQTGHKVNLTLHYKSSTSSSPEFQVYEGNTTNQILVSSGNADSLPLPFTVISKTNEIVLRVTPKAHCQVNTRNTLRFSYTATSTSKYGCGGSMDLTTRTVFSPGYPSSYTARALECYWRITEATGRRIKISFPEPINIFPGLDRFMLENDSVTTTETSIFDLSGTVHPHPVVTSSNAATIRFRTSNSSPAKASLYKGWHATWNLV